MAARFLCKPGYEASNHDPAGTAFTGSPGAEVLLSLTSGALQLGIMPDPGCGASRKYDYRSPGSSSETEIWVPAFLLLNTHCEGPLFSVSSQSSPWSYSCMRRKERIVPILVLIASPVALCLATARSQPGFGETDQGTLQNLHA